MRIRVGARDSLLSKKQVEEVLLELRQFHPAVEFDVLWMKTTGDKNLQVSLIHLEKTDFFTKEIDEALLSGICDIGIHSAKDLPEPLPPHLVIFALTKGVDSSDSLVMRLSDSLETLPKNPRIGTSSLRRIKMLQDIRDDCIPTDIRGTILDRLKLLDEGKVDALIVAEAALIRLNLLHLNRIRLQGEVALHQGRLAVVGREKDLHLFQLLQTIHAG